MHVVPKLGTGKDKASSKLHDAGFTHCHQGRSQDFLKGGSHCVKQRVLTRLWCFRHLNIVGCLLKKRLTKGGGGGGGSRAPHGERCSSGICSSRDN